MRISIVIPARNERKRIPKTLRRYLEFFRDLKKRGILDFEIVIVLNGCVDKTREVVESFRAKEIEILEFEHAGKGFAIIQGFKDAKKRNNDLIGFVDADMATSPESFYDLVKNINKYDGIIASRGIKNAVAKRIFLRKIAGRVFNFLTRAMFLMPYRDTQCGAKVFKKIVIERIIDEIRMIEWIFDINFLYSARKKGYKIKEHPTIWQRKEGSKIVNIPRTSIIMFSRLIKLRMIYSPFGQLLKQKKPILGIVDKLMKKESKTE